MWPHKAADTNNQNYINWLSLYYVRYVVSLGIFNIATEVTILEVTWDRMKSKLNVKGHLREATVCISDLDKLNWAIVV